MKMLEFEVIAEYPGMMHEIGKIITTYDSGTSYLVEIDTDGYGCGVSEKGSCLDYPHLFKKVREYEKD